MGWSSANEIFDPVCEEVIRQVKTTTGMYPDDARRILSVLIDALQQGDWNTEDESLDKYKEHSYVVAAFNENDIKLPSRTMIDVELPDDDSDLNFEHGGPF